MAFKRTLTDSIVSSIQKEELFQSKLLNDMNMLKVYPAIRNKYIDFYHYGMRIFQYNGEFKTHKKFLSLISTDYNYVSEAQVKNASLVTDFCSQYNDIKYNALQYSGLEKLGTSSLYHRYSFLNQESDIVVLDTEIAFSAFDKSKYIDKVDLLLLSKKDKKLLFIEAKHFDNGDLWSSTYPKVVDQLERYNNQIYNKYNEILDAYTEYVDLSNRLFNTRLPQPTEIMPECCLYVFGFDQNQKMKLENDFKINAQSNGITYYAKGDYKKADANTIWKALSE